MAGNLNVGSINDVGFMPINLAINPEFTIKQRGAASPTAATGYNYDRWYYDGSSLLQGIENLNLRATTYVVSWEGSATCSYSLNTAASSSQGSQTYTSITNGGTLTIASVGSNNLWIKFSGTLTGLTKVYVVPSGTKSPFLPRQYQQELALCQRYYQILTSMRISGYTTTGNEISVPVTYGGMRVAPTAVSSGFTLINVANGAQPFPTNMSFTGGSLRIVSGGGGPTGAYDGTVTLSAEL